MEQWFIARDGKQEGPITAQQVNALVASGSLNPSTTLCWRDGMVDWIPLADSGVLALAAPVAKTVGQAVLNPYTPPIHDPRNSEVEVHEYPGIGRLAYFGWTMLVTIIGYAILLGMMFFALNGGSGSVGFSVLVFGLIAIAMMAGVFYVGVKRVRNLGMSGWAILWSLVPFMNIWIGWRMIACPSGYEHHRTLDVAGKVMTGVFVGFMVLSIAANVFVAVSQS